MKIIKFILIFSLVSLSQQIPPDRLIDWSNAGIIDLNFEQSLQVSVTNYGFDTTEFLPNNELLEQIFQEYPDQKIQILFPAGTFLFDKQINLRSNISLKGQGASATKLIFDQNGSGHQILARGKIPPAEMLLAKPASIRATRITVLGHDLLPKDWIKIGMDDQDLATSS